MCKLIECHKSSRKNLFFRIWPFKLFLLRSNLLAVSSSFLLSFSGISRILSIAITSPTLSSLSCGVIFHAIIVVALVNCSGDQ